MAGGTGGLLDIEVEIKRLHAEGLSNRSIADNLGMKTGAVRYRIRKMGLSSNREYGTPGEPPIPVDAEHSLCNKCGEVTRNEDFPFVINRSDGRRLSYCRKCRAGEGRINRTKTPEAFWRDKENRIRNNVRGKSVNLSEGHLLQRWLEQSGKCFYTDVALEIGYGKGKLWTLPSVDRIDTTRGYEDGNIAICSDRINRIKWDVTLDEMKVWMPDWYKRATDYLEEAKNA